MQSVEISSLSSLPMASDASDAIVVSRVIAGEREWFAVLMRRYNQRLFRIARSVTRDDHDAEDAVQRAYIAAFRDLRSFRHEAQLGTWLTTITLREAMRGRTAEQRRRDVHDEARRISEVVPARTPEDDAQLGELRASVEAAVDALPEHYRLVLVMRDVQGMAAGEVADALELTDEAVRVRLHRARGMLRERIARRVDVPWPQLFAFAGARCDRIVDRVWAAITSA